MTRRLQSVERMPDTVPEVMFQRVVIVGPGLIGGSLGIALRAAGLAGRVVGVGHRQESLDAALELGAVDEATFDLEGAVADADLVVLAVSVGRIPELASRAAPQMKNGAVLTDVGSVKAPICSAVEALLRTPSRPRVRFVGGHPLAGSEKRGVRAARSDLFRDALCILTPSRVTDPDGTALSRVRDMWQAVGCRVRELPPELHDELVAEISHLPHVVAACLINAVSDGALDLAGSGFADTTRVASGDPGLWRDICMANSRAVDKALHTFAEQVRTFRKALASGDADAIDDCLRGAKERRDAGFR